MTQYELSLVDYWRILRKRARIVLGITAGVFLLTLLYLNQQSPVYRATAKIKLEKSQTVAGKLFEYQSYYENPMVTESRVIESRSIAEAVVRRLHPDLPTEGDGYEALVSQVQGAIQAEPIQETNIIGINVTSQEPEWVARVANLTAEAYIAFNQEEKNKQARKVREFVESQLIRTEVQLKITEELLTQMREEGTATGTAVVLQNRLSELQSQLTQQMVKLTEAHPDVMRLRAQIAQMEKDLQNMPAAELDFARLNREKEVNEKAYRSLRERLEEARIAEAEKVADASIIEQATVPGGPISPRKKLGMTVGLLLGLLVGCIMSFIIETLDTSIGTIEDLEANLKLPVLAVIPHFGPEQELGHRPWDSLLARMRTATPSGSEDDWTALQAYRYPRSTATEAYRILKTNLKFSPERKILLVTSAGPGEGKSTLVINLGLVCAQSGARTLLVSSDLRRPELGKLFHMPRESGLTEVLQGAMPLDRSFRGFSDFVLGRFGYDEVIRNPYLANLFILTSGRLPENPVELLGLPAMRDIFLKLRHQFDVVLVDAPPLLPVADSLLLAPHADGTILVYQAGRISRAALIRAKGLLDSVGATQVGVVLNHVRPEVQTQPRDYYYYRQSYAYGPKEEHLQAASTPE